MNMPSRLTKDIRKNTENRMGFFSRGLQEDLSQRQGAEELHERKSAANLQACITG